MDQIGDVVSDAVGQFRRDRKNKRQKEVKEEGDDMTDKILLVEDEEKLARMVELELKYEGYQVDKAADGRTGLDMAQTGDYDLILLDIMLPALNGMEVLRRLRREAWYPSSCSPPGTR